MAAVLFLGIGACATASPESPTDTGGSGSTSHADSGSQQPSSSGDDSTPINSDDSSVTPVETDDASVSSDDSSAPATGDDGSTGTGTTPPPITFPPLTLPEAGSSTPDDGGANSCTTKICIDPVFDCPLQGCFNGCVNLHCM